MSTKLATRWNCGSTLASIHCVRNETKRNGRSKCGYCGGKLYPSYGRYGVFRWTGTGTYPTGDAVKVFTIKSAADKYAQTHGDDLVVRWMPAAWEV